MKSPTKLLLPSKTPDLLVGDLANPFVLPNSQGMTVAVPVEKSKFTVLFFYPKDNTPGCTTESQDFSKQNKEFQKLGVRVFGISKDSVASHLKFQSKFELQIELLSDADGFVCEHFGVIKEKSMYGKKFIGIERSTFILDSHFRIIQSYRKVKVEGHAQAILEEVRNRV